MHSFVWSSGKKSSSGAIRLREGIRLRGASRLREVYIYNPSSEDNLASGNSSSESVFGYTEFVSSSSEFVFGK